MIKLWINLKHIFLGKINEMKKKYDMLCNTSAVFLKHCDMTHDGLKWFLTLSV